MVGRYVQYKEILNLTNEPTGALSPKQLQERCSSDDSFRNRMFQWLESVFKHSLPEGTHSVDGTYYSKKRCLLARPPHPDSVFFDDVYMQFLREVLDASDQQHKHSDTCFKKTSRTIGSLTPEEQDTLCRFNLPAPIVDHTHIDDDGKLHIKRLDGRTVAYNETVSVGCQCNTDAKFIGSGPLGMAMAIYMTNYTAKSSLDSAVVVSALTAAVANLTTTQNEQVTTIDEEACRRLLLKTLNQMNARRELSAQQVASSLLGFPNHFTSSRFAVFYWTKTLQWLSPTNFTRACMTTNSDLPLTNNDTR